MARGDTPALIGLELGDRHAAWAQLGFTVDADHAVRIGTVTLSFSGEGGGIRGWSLACDGGAPEDVDGIATGSGAVATAPSRPHPNAATRLDHVVVATPDMGRTLSALTERGLQVSRIRETGLDGSRARQAFLWAGDVLLEVAGPQEPEGAGPASLWGLVIVTTAIDTLADVTGSRVGAIRDAVQAGRRIATVHAQAHLGVPLAFMTPHV